MISTWVRGLVQPIDNVNMTRLNDNVNIKEEAAVNLGRGLVGVAETAAELAGAALRPEHGELSMPVLTLDMAAFERNSDAMLDYAKRHKLLLAPHAKTPMSSDLGRRLIDKGAWGLSVANLQQAAVMLEAGFSPLVVSNQIGGVNSGARFGRVLADYPTADAYFFVDSIESVRAVAAAAKAAGRPLSVMIEVGSGRAGARDLNLVADIVFEVLKHTSLSVAGIACYEGAAAKASPDETEKAIAELCNLAIDAFSQLRGAMPTAPLMISAGGSSFFDLVVRHLLPVVNADGNAQLMLRSGAIFFHDHGVYERALADLDARHGFAPSMGRSASDSFIPALRVWAEVLSRPEPDLVICGMGMRDVSSDQDLPRPLHFYRDGAVLGATAGARVFKLNDQHAFLRVAADHPARVGDIVEFGISHPCTCLDRWRVILGRDQSGAVTDVFPTQFG